MGKTKLFADSIAKKLKGAKTLDEVKDIAAQEGYELSDDQLDGIAGGIGDRIIDRIIDGIQMPELPDERIECHGFFIS